MADNLYACQVTFGQLLNFVWMRKQPGNWGQFGAFKWSGVECSGVAWRKKLDGNGNGIGIGYGNGNGMRWLEKVPKVPSGCQTFATDPEAEERKRKREFSPKSNRMESKCEIEWNSSFVLVAAAHKLRQWQGRAAPGNASSSNSSCTCPATLTLYLCRRRHLKCISCDQVRPQRWNPEWPREMAEKPRINRVGGG